MPYDESATGEPVKIVNKSWVPLIVCYIFTTYTPSMMSPPVVLATKWSSISRERCINDWLESNRIRPA